MDIINRFIYYINNLQEEIGMIKIVRDQLFYLNVLFEVDTIYEIGSSKTDGPIKVTKINEAIINNDIAYLTQQTNDDLSGDVLLILLLVDKHDQCIMMSFLLPIELWEKEKILVYKYIDKIDFNLLKNKNKFKSKRKIFPWVRKYK